MRQRTVGPGEPQDAPDELALDLAAPDRVVGIVPEAHQGLVHRHVESPT